MLIKESNGIKSITFCCKIMSDFIMKNNIVIISGNIGPLELKYDGIKLNYCSSCGEQIIIKTKD